jgi:hypothetical protein
MNPAQFRKLYSGAPLVDRIRCPHIGGHGDSLKPSHLPLLRLAVQKFIKSKTIRITFNMSDKVSSQNGLSNSETHEQTLDRVRSAGILTISPELFEKLYLQPKTAVKGDLRSILGNPTPL